MLNKSSKRNLRVSGEYPRSILDENFLRILQQDHVIKVLYGSLGNSIRYTALKRLDEHCLIKILVWAPNWSMSQKAVGVNCWSCFWVRLLRPLFGFHFESSLIFCFSPPMSIYSLNLQGRIGSSIFIRSPLAKPTCFALYPVNSISVLS